MIVRQQKSSHKKKVTLTQFGTALLTQLSESCTAGVANCPCVRRKQEAPLQMTPAAACLKRHSCEICLSNYLLDLQPKMPKHFSSILSYFSRMTEDEVVAFIATVGCRCCRSFLCRKKQVLQCKSANSTARFLKYPTQSIQRKAADGA